jgi:hypothetical protein
LSEDRLSVGIGVGANMMKKGSDCVKVPSVFTVYLIILNLIMQT